MAVFTPKNVNTPPKANDEPWEIISLNWQDNNKYGWKWGREVDFNFINKRVEQNEGKLVYKATLVFKNIESPNDNVQSQPKEIIVSGWV